MTRPSFLPLLLLAGFLTGAAPQPAAAFDEDETAEIESIVRNYLVRNPEVLLEAIEALEAQQLAEVEGRQREALELARDELLATPEGAALGNPEGDVTIVEFFDYNCGFCQRAHADMESLIENDPELRVVLKEIPVLGQASEEASRVSLAVRQVAPERYGEFHGRLLTGEATADEAEAIRVATDLGIDETELRGAMDDPTLVSAIQEGPRLAAVLNITGTPSYVIGDEVLIGAVGAEELAERIANVRECGSASC